jgi:protein SCO1/2
MTELNNLLEAPPPQIPPVKPAPQRLPATRNLLWATIFLLILIVGGFAVWWYYPPQLHGIQLQSPRVADDFTLPTSTGETMSLSDFRGKYVVLFFGYTYCPDVCPTTLNDIQQMLKALGTDRADDVQVVMVSVDPERDTPEQLAEYLGYFDSTFIGMTGTVEEIQPVASQFGIFFERAVGSDNTNYLVDHTAAVTLIDPEGHVRMIFTYGVTGADMASDIAYLMRRG